MGKPEAGAVMSEYVIKNSVGQYYDVSADWSFDRQRAYVYSSRCGALNDMSVLARQNEAVVTKLVKLSKRPKSKRTGWVIRTTTTRSGSPWTYYRAMGDSYDFDTRDKATVFDEYYDAVEAYHNAGFWSSRIVKLKGTP